jgi:multimeric flavodoxin WrbA
MRITILNGEPDSGTAFDEYVRRLTAALLSRGHEVERLDLRELNIRRCRGCMECWIRTPGECTSRDGSPIVCREVLASDLAIFASPMVMGFPTELIKRATDKLIPLLHPYTRVIDGEFGHRKRYKHYADFALLLDPGEDSDATDVEITSAVWERTARMFHGKLVLTATTTWPPGEVADAVTHR